MRFYERMNTLDREIMVLKAVRQNVAMEGMPSSVKKFTEEILELERKKVKATLQEENQTTE